MYVSKKVAFFLISVFVFSLNACSKISGQTFKNRYEQGRADDFIKNNVGADVFAASPHSLQTFKNKYEQGRADDFIKNNIGATVFAASPHSL
jgi:hypothetical protein